jgi:hypothetical protein
LKIRDVIAELNAKLLWRAPDGFVAQLLIPPTTSGASRALATSACIRATMSRGVLAATNHACHPAAPNPGGSASEAVGTSGKIGERAGPITAKARNCPMSINGLAVASGTIAM